METAETEVTLEDHMDRCRLCLNLIGESDVLYKVCAETKKKFEFLTSLELTMDPQLFSSFLCVSCNRDLNKFSIFRENLIRKQTKLYEIIYTTGELVENCEDQQLEQQIIQEEELVQEVNNVTSINEEILDEEMLECDQYFVDEDGSESIQVESLVEESDGNEAVVIVQNGKFDSLTQELLSFCCMGTVFDRFLKYIEN